MRTRCMTLFAAVAATAFLLLLSAAPAVADETDRSQEVASFYCVTTSPVYYQGKQVWPGSAYCVPGP